MLKKAMIICGEKYLTLAAKILFEVLSQSV
jgi:hypothetical protein